MNQRAAGLIDVCSLVGAVVCQHVLLDTVHGQLGRADRYLDGLAILYHGNGAVCRIPGQAAAHRLYHAAQRQHGIAAGIQCRLAALGVDRLGRAVYRHGRAVNRQNDGAHRRRRRRSCRRDCRQCGQQQSCAHDQRTQPFSQFHCHSSL